MLWDASSWNACVRIHDPRGVGFDAATLTLCDAGTLKLLGRDYLNPRTSLDRLLQTIWDTKWVFFLRVQPRARDPTPVLLKSSLMVTEKAHTLFQPPDSPHHSPPPLHCSPDPCHHHSPSPPLPWSQAPSPCSLRLPTPHQCSHPILLWMGADFPPPLLACHLSGWPYQLLPQQGWAAPHRGGGWGACPGWGRLPACHRGDGRLLAYPDWSRWLVGQGPGRSPRPGVRIWQA